MLELNRIHCGDNCDLLGKMPRESVDLVVTSPPYDDLRTYGGHSWDFFGVAWQLKRVLKPGGVIVWVVRRSSRMASSASKSSDCRPPAVGAVWGIGSSVVMDRVLSRQSIQW